jgi:hypothetical protein
MRVLFCKISNMKYYKGACNDDVPMYGGAFVDEWGYGHEEFNFKPITNENKEDARCFGFVEPKSNKGTRNTLHIEKIEGCTAMKKAEFVEDVLVVWCAKREKGDITVVGWYKNAVVYRDLEEYTLLWDNGEEEERYFNVEAYPEDCVLLPASERTREWYVPVSKVHGFGFGQSMIWYPNVPEAQAYLERLVEKIENYKGENWLNRYPDFSK